MTAQRIEFIDFAKGFAISTIVVMHALMLLPMTPLFGKLIIAGGAGVHLFIFLSGFGLALSRQVSVKEFFKRRMVKIVIPYYVCITVIFILNLFFHLYPDGFYAYLGHLLFFKMFDERIMTSFGYHFWFVSTILQLYAVYPLLGLCKQKFGPRIFFLGCLALSVAWWIWLSISGLYTQRVYGSFFLQYLWEFALGMVAVQAYQNGFCFWNTEFTKVALMGVIALGVYAALSLIGGPGKVFNDIPALLGYGCLCLICFRLLSGKQVIKDAVAVIGKHSYMIYLWHGVILAVIGRAFRFY